MKLQAQSVLFSGLLLACSGGEDADTAAASDTAAVSDTDTDTDTDTDVGVDTIEFTVTFVEFLTQEPIVGATLKQGGETFTTDANGSATIPVEPNSGLAYTLTADGFRDHYLYRRIEDSDLSVTGYLSSISTSDLVLSTLGMENDESKVLLTANVLGPIDDNGGASLAGVTVDLSVGYALSLVTDAEAPGGFSLGNTTLEGSDAAVIFIHADAGTITPSLAGGDCDSGFDSFDVPAGSYVIATYNCE